jgi:hypothetical protein
MASKGRELLGSCRLLCKGEGRHKWDKGEPAIHRAE